MASILHYHGYKERVEKLIEQMIGDTEEQYRVYIRYVIRGGKRIRPIIALSIMDQCLDKKKMSDISLNLIERTCLGVEMLHAASLILDDLPACDNSTERRGQPCIHVKYGEAAALMTSGHLLMDTVSVYCRAYRQALREELCTAESFLHLIELVSDQMSFKGACGGQLIDLGYIKGSDIHEAIQKKTGSFFEIAFLTGFMISRPNATIADISKIREAAKHMAIVLQLQDDFSPSDRAEDGVENNYVNLFGEKKAYKDFETSVNRVTEILKEFDLYSPVMDEIITMLRMNVRAHIA